MNGKAHAGVKREAVGGLGLGLSPGAHGETLLGKHEGGETHQDEDTEVLRVDNLGARTYCPSRSAKQLLGSMSAFGDYRRPCFSPADLMMPHRSSDNLRSVAIVDAKPS